jgi:hypothetical protein
MNADRAATHYMGVTACEKYIITVNTFSDIRAWYEGVTYW